MFYQKILKPILFKTDPEKIHEFVTFAGSTLGKFSITRKITSAFFRYGHPSLIQTIDGIKYHNPVGLAAGFDKDANLTKIMPSIGFGFEEVGSVTYKSCKGNPKPRLWRLPKYKSLVVYYGLKNKGSRKIARKFYSMKKIKNFPLGISIAKTNCKETVDVNTAILDYYHSLGILEPFADYITINISCPNTFGGQPFSSPELLEQLLTKLDTITPDTIALDTVKPKKPRYIKLSPDLTKKEVDGIISICMKHKVQGFIISNLLKKRENSNIPLSAFNKVGMGGLSGKPVENYSNQLISYVYAKTKGKMTIIGCGGIFNSRDAYAKIKAGASLVQLITAMIYQGPGVINEINKGLVKLVKKDGFSNISEAVGVDHRLR